VAQSFLLSTFFSRKKTSLIVGYFLVLGLALVCGILVDNTISNVLEAKNSTRLAISLVPTFALYRGLVYLAAEVSWEGPGFRMATLDDKLVNLAGLLPTPHPH
jgi:ABC-type transport system involved in multi-copper enzyme maturation permease subunit